MDANKHALGLEALGFEAMDFAKLRRSCFRFCLDLQAKDTNALEASELSASAWEQPYLPS